MQPMDTSALDSALHTEIDGMHQQLKSIEERVKHAENRLQRSEGRGRVYMVTLVLVLGATILLPVASPALAQGYGFTLQQILSRLNALETKTACMSVSKVSEPNGSGGTITVPTMRFSGVNVQIVDGSGGTIVATGTGNLIIGYNELRNDGTDDHTGSHNLIIGSNNSYTANAYGGMVVGYFNTVSGNYSSISGGFGSLASGQYSSITGGAQNRASGFISSVTGGYANVANGYVSSVSGGSVEVASGNFSWAGGSYYTP